MPSLNDLKIEVWMEMQNTLFVENTAVFLADTTGAGVLSDDGKIVHRPILSKARTGVYTPYDDITFNQQDSEDQTLEVSTFLYGAEQIDWTDKYQTMRYNPVEFSAQSMQRNLNNRIEQNFLSNISDSAYKIDAGNVGGSSGSPLDFSGPTIFDVFEQTDSYLGSVDAPVANRVAVLGPHSVSAIRKLKSQRETPLGDRVLENGVIGEWNGWMIVQNNNLPYSATITIGAEPSNGDTIKVANITFTFVTSLGSTPGNVLIGGSATNAATNLMNALTGGTGAGTDYVELEDEDQFLLYEKRQIAVTDDTNVLSLTGFGDITIVSDFTSGSNTVTDQQQSSYLGLRGAIDLVVQIDPNNIRIIEKEAGFADLVKGLLGMGSQMFNDGARVSINVNTDASSWR